MEDMVNVVPEETVEVAVEEVTKHLDGESFMIGAVLGTAVTGGLWLLVKKVVIPTGKKIKVRIQQRKADKIEAFESDGFDETEET